MARSLKSASLSAFPAADYWALLAGVAQAERRVTLTLPTQADAWSLRNDLYLFRQVCARDRQEALAAGIDPDVLQAIKIRAEGPILTLWARLHDTTTQAVRAALRSLPQVGHLTLPQQAPSPVERFAPASVAVPGPIVPSDDFLARLRRETGGPDYPEPPQGEAAP